MRNCERHLVDVAYLIIIADRYESVDSGEGFVMENEIFQDAAGCGYENYKDIKIKKIDAIRLAEFRTVKNKTMELGDVITVVSGKNGTMKSTLLGLIAHPFSSPNNARDAFGNQLKTRHSEVFYLSPEKDSDQYLYYLRITTTDDITFEEPIRVYKRLNPDGKYRHRVTVGKDNKEGRGNFSLNTSFVNLKRLIPIIDTNAKVDDEEMAKTLKSFVADGYMRILQKEAFLEPVQVSDKNKKQTFGPGENAEYDYRSISSGEDNVGHILSKMHAFIQYKTNNLDALQGIFCIDEIEASLHPVAQVNLFEYIYNWAKNNHIQVVINTHSLYLIQHVLELQSKLQNKNDVVLNMISTAFVSDNNYNVIKNPNYNEAYKELTLKDKESIHDIYKVFVICEDDVAEYYLKRLISKTAVLRRLEFLHGLKEDEKGNGYAGLKALIKNGRKLLENTIVFFDADVNVDDLKRCKSYYFVLPSLHGLPLEKDLVKYIYDLPGDDPFFVKFDKERATFCNEFAGCGITNLTDVEEIKNDNVKKYKTWSKGQKDFKKYISFFVKSNLDNNMQFLSEVEDCLNKLFVSKGIPPISLK